jgi:molybdopterin molybdotransferase
MAFLQLALPGILRMAGRMGNPLLNVPARLTRDIPGRHSAWTEFKKGKLERGSDGCYSVTPYVETSRLKNMADSSCIICKPEGVKALHGGQIITVQLTLPTPGELPIADM